MKYNGQDISSFNIDQLESIDWALAEKEYEFKQSLNNDRIKKLKPKPILGKTFTDLRQAVKEEMIRKREHGISDRQ